MVLTEQELYERFFEKVYRTAFYIVKSEEMAKDITHETFIKVFKSIKKIKDDSKIDPWITTIATRTAIDFYNKNKKQRTVEFVENRYVSETDINFEDKDEISMYLNTLTPEQKQILILKYFEDLSEKDIAKQLKVKVGTVKSRLFRAKQNLLKEIQSGGVHHG